MTPIPVSERFGEDHARLAGEMRALADTVEGAPSGDIQDRWARFEAGLRAHFDTEERFFVPALEAAHPTEAARVRAEHARFRRRLVELAVDADLHTLRLDAVSAFLEELAGHAAWEQDTLYPWADEALDEAARRSAFAWLADRANTLFARAGGALLH